MPVVPQQPVAHPGPVLRAWLSGEDDAVTEPVIPEAGLVPVGHADLLELVKAAACKPPAW